MPSFIGQYIKDCSNMYKVISTNPVKMTGPMKINTTLAMPPIVIKDMSRVFSLGVKLFKNYKETIAQ